MFKRKPSHRHDLIAALDMGTTRVSCAIARVVDENSFQVVGCGQHMMRGLKRGVIVDMEAVCQAVVQAVHSAERQAEENIEKVYVGIPATVIHSETLTLEVAVSPSAPIEMSDLQQVFSQLQEREHLQGREVLHAIPLSYQLDEQKGIYDPKGMYGEKLVVTLHVLTAPLNVLRNFMACMVACHLEIAGFVAAPHASALATLVEDEMELGTTLIDMGGGSTSLISYVNGRPVFLSSIPLGGQHITQDIARIISTPLIQAERLKTLYGAALLLTSDEREVIAVPQVGENDLAETINISKAQLNQVIQPRLEEIFSYLRQRLVQSEGAVLQGRLVLTGGGSQLAGIRDFVQAQMGHKQVRIGHVHIPGMEDITQGAMQTFSTCAGVLKYATRESALLVSATRRKSPSWWGRLKGLFGDF